MARGVDVTTLDMTPEDLSGDHGYKYPVIQLTCAQGKTRTISGTLYELPDQIWTLSQIPGGLLSSVVEIFKTSKDIRRSMSSDVGGGLQLTTFGFSASSSYKRMQHTVANTSSYIEHVSAFFSGRRADFNFHFALDLDPFVQRYIDNNLPASFANNPTPYEDFIRYFGTHYFSTAKFGGMISLLLETQSSYFNGKTDAQVKRQAETSFLGILKAKGGYQGSVATIDEQFEKLTTKAVRYYGGNANLLSSQGLQQWQPTIPAHPWLFSGQLTPISALIKDDAKRASMEEAVTNHILHAYLDELSRLLYGHLSSFPSLSTLLSRVKDFQRKRILAIKRPGQEREKRVRKSSEISPGYEQGQVGKFRPVMCSTRSWTSSAKTAR
nr:hypothetical protein BaRGS_005281 [Batillaria attramentaria]